MVYPATVGMAGEILVFLLTKNCSDGIILDRLIGILALTRLGLNQCNPINKVAILLRQRYFSILSIHLSEIP